MRDLFENFKKKTETRKEETSDKETSTQIFVERPKINFLFKLIYNIQKNLRIIIRSKISAFIFIFGPLLIIALVALAFNTSTLFDLNIATYSDSYSPLSESILSNLSDNQYNIIKINSKSECIDAVESSNFQVCVVFPPDMTIDNNANNLIKIYVDNSRLNIANFISSQISTKVSIEASALSSDLVTEILTVLDSANTKTVQTKAIINTIDNQNKEVQNSLSSLNSKLSEVDFSYSTFDITTIDTEIDAIQTQLNISSDIFTDLNTAINNLKTEYTTLSAKLDTNKNSISTATTSTSTISSQLNTQETKLNEANTNLQEITDSITKISITNVANIISPVKTEIDPISSINNYLLYILPTILVLIIMLVALLMSSSSIISEKESRAYFRNFITPTNDFIFMAGEFLSNIIILGMQIVIILFVLYYFLHTILRPETFLYTGLALLIIGSFFILLGMLWGYIFNTKQTVTLATISSALIMLFFSNTILPLETISSSMRNIIQYNPFIIGEVILKKILLFGANFIDISHGIYLLLGFSLAVLIGAILSRTLSKKYFNTD